MVLRKEMLMASRKEKEQIVIYDLALFTRRGSS
jgi:hypothetical protein